MTDTDRRPARRVLRAISAQPWAITEAALQMILDIAARETLPIEAVEAQMGRPLDNTHTVTVRDGVASIPIQGPICRYASSFDAISGATSIETIATDFTAALADPQVKAILLSVDSPGGEVAGTSELAQMIFEARGRKPIVAYASGEDCSAAYWLSSAADEVIVEDTTIVGSIGVVCVVPDPTATSAKQVQFVSSQSPNKRPDPTTQSGADQIQTTVDDLATLFVAAVARNRNVPEATVLDDFGHGGVFVGQKAVAAGLADRVGSYESVLAELAAKVAHPSMSMPQRVAGRSAAHQPLTTTARSTRVKLKDFILGRAEAEGVDLDPADLEAAFTPGPSADLSTLQAAMAARDAEIAGLKVAQERYEVQIRQAAADRRHAEAQAYAAGLVSSHRLTPAGAEALTPLLAYASDADAAAGVTEAGAVALVTAFAATLPDLSVFTTEQIASDQVAVLPAALTTAGVDGIESPNPERVNAMLNATPEGRAVLAARKAARTS